MRKIILLLLSVTILSIAGCGKKDMDVSTETKATEVVAEDISETESIKATEEATETEVVETVTEETEADNKEEDIQTANEDSNDKALEQSENSNDSDSNQNSSNGQSIDTNQGQNSQAQQTEQTTASEPTPEPTPEPEQSQVINYSPENVVALATAKTKAAGKILLTENLDNLLANGQITQEEYNEYYPYDGAGYYSVFVDSNLAEARDVSGTEHFNSEDDIAQYISDMLVLENGPYFLIEYAGTYDYYGKICYEFRCYRA